MTTDSKLPKATMVSGAFIWIGLVLGISFIESWLKFQAPGITVDLGVGIGRLVFGFVNKVEIVLALILILALWNCTRSWGKIKPHLRNTLGLVVLVLMIQTFILLPVMDARADLRLQGEEVGPSFLHIYYVAGEILKVVGLSIFGMKSIL